MERTKLFAFQVYQLRNRLDFTYDKIESAVLNKYKAPDIENLNSTDFDDIMEDISDWHYELNEKAR